MRVRCGLGHIKQMYRVPHQENCQHDNVDDEDRRVLPTHTEILVALALCVYMCVCVCVCVAEAQLSRWDHLSEEAYRTSNNRTCELHVIEYMMECVCVFF